MANDLLVLDYNRILTTVSDGPVNNKLNHYDQWIVKNNYTKVLHILEFSKSDKVKENHLSDSILKSFFFVFGVHKPVQVYKTSSSFMNDFSSKILSRCIIISN